MVSLYEDCHQEPKEPRTHPTQLPPAPFRPAPIAPSRARQDKSSTSIEITPRSGVFSEAPLARQPELANWPNGANGMIGRAFPHSEKPSDRECPSRPSYRKPSVLTRGESSGSCRTARHRGQDRKTNLQFMRRVASPTHSQAAASVIAVGTINPNTLYGCEDFNRTQAVRRMRMRNSQQNVARCGR